jgi:hypothetical protein
MGPAGEISKAATRGPSAAGSWQVKIPPLSSFFIASPARARSKSPSASRSASHRLKSSDCQAEMHRRRRKRSRAARRASGSSLPRSRARPTAALRPRVPKRWAPKKLAKPRSARAAAQARARASSPPRTATSKRFPRACPTRSLLPWREARSTRKPSPPSEAGSGSRAAGKESHWLATAALSFIPAKPASRSATPRARASSRTTSRVVRPRFSTRSQRCGPEPAGR